MVKHTLVLVQFTSNKASRQYHDFASVSAAMDGICKFFEQKLRQQNPNSRNLTYDIKDLYDYIDSLSDLGALIFDPKINAYVPHNKDWIKQRVLKQLQKVANQGQQSNQRDSMRY